MEYRAVLWDLCHTEDGGVKESLLSMFELSFYAAALIWIAWRFTHLRKKNALRFCFSHSALWFFVLILLLLLLNEPFRVSCSSFPGLFSFYANSNDIIACRNTKKIALMGPLLRSYTHDKWRTQHCTHTVCFARDATLRSSTANKIDTHRQLGVICRKRNSRREEQQKKKPQANRR